MLRLEIELVRYAWKNIETMVAGIKKAPNFFEAFLVEDPEHSGRPLE